MLASFTDSQTGQNPTKASQDLHEHRCLQGSNITHDLRELHTLQQFFIIILPSPQKDSASLSVTRISVLLSSVTFASFSLAFLCQFCLSISILLRHCSRSFVFFVAIDKFSFLWDIKVVNFDSYLCKINNSCCLDSACKVVFNLSFCFGSIQKFNHTKPRVIDFHVIMQSPEKPRFKILHK